MHLIILRTDLHATACTNEASKGARTFLTAAIENMLIKE